MSNKKYHFVKVGLVNDPTYNGTWYFKPETKEDVDEHWNKYVVSEIHDGVREYVDRLKAHAEGKSMGHSTTEWGCLMDIWASATGQPNIIRLFKEETELYYNRMRDINEGREIYLSEGLTVFMLTEGYTEVIEHYYSDTLSFPTEKYTIDDVRYIQWDGGKHWYAKIGKLDIVDDNGNQKWNTKAEAEQAAKEYIKKL